MPDAALPNRLSAGVSVTNGRACPIWTHARRAGKRVRTDRTVDFQLGEASRARRGRADGPTSVEREELSRLRRENRRLHLERDILAAKSRPTTTLLQV